MAADLLIDDGVDEVGLLCCLDASSLLEIIVVC